MDLTRDIIYRGFTLNDSTLYADMTAGTPLAGCVVDSFDFSDVDVVQFVEKRSQQDGMDAGDVFLGSRRIRMGGTLYGSTRADLFDRMWDLRAALSPVLAQREEPLDYGYQPLYFSVPTNDPNYDGAGGLIELQIKALPRAFGASVMRDSQGGEDIDALAIPWQATFLCKDPSIMAATPQDYTLVGASPVSGNLDNRGTYIVPVNALFLFDGTAGSVACTIGDSNFTITVPSDPAQYRLLRFKGEDKVLTLQDCDSGGVATGAEVPRMDLLTFNNSTTWPLIPSGMTQAYSWTYTTVSPATGSHFWFYERYA